MNLLGESDRAAPRTVSSVWAGERAVQTARWKLVSEFRPGDPRLFDLAADPDERLDVADAHEDQREMLRQVMNAQAERDAGLLPRIERTLDELRAVGYVQ